MDDDNIIMYKFIFIYINWTYIYVIVRIMYVVLETRIIGGSRRHKQGAENIPREMRKCVGLIY